MSKKQIKEKVIDLYYNKHYKQIDIAKQIGISRQRVLQIVKECKEYEKELNYRQSQNKEKIISLEYNKKTSSYKIRLPIDWIRKLNFTEDDKHAIIKIVNDKQIIIEKFNTK